MLISFPPAQRGAAEHKKSARCQYDFGPLWGTQSTALALEPLADEAGRMRFRLAPNDVAGVAAKIDGHLGTKDGLDLAPLARPTHRVRRPICRAPIVHRVRAGLEHLWHSRLGDKDSVARRAPLLSGVSLRRRESAGPERASDQLQPFSGIARCHSSTRANISAPERAGSYYGCGSVNVQRGRLDPSQSTP